MHVTGDIVNIAVHGLLPWHYSVLMSVTVDRKRVVPTIRQEGMSMQVATTVSRFFGFFFTLLVTIAVVIAAYTIVAGQPVDKIWSAVEALVIAAVAVLVLAVAAALIPDFVEKRRPMRAVSPDSGEGPPA
jgi:uncharacterized membrane protein